MSTTPTRDVSRTIEHCRPTTGTPVDVDAATLDSTAPVYLRRLKRELGREQLYPARVIVSACFDESCSLTTQAEVDRIREYVRAASELGASTITVECDTVADPETVRPALSACAERAQRNGLEFDLHGPISLD